MKIKIKKLHPQVKIPLKATKDAAGADLYAFDIGLNGNQKHATVYLGFSTEIPKGYKAVIVPRSSFTQKGWVMQNSPAQIDCDYRGAWMLKFEAIPEKWNDFHFDMHYPSFPYKVGDRVAQVFFEKVVPYEFEEVTDLVETERGEGGFGSTGK